MAPSLNFLEKIKKGLFDYSQDAGKMLLHTATAGWILSAAGQIFGIATNKKVSKKEKQFLIPQELADAAINIVSFYVLTDSIQNFTKSLASKGKIITPYIKKFCGEHGIVIGKNAEGKYIKIGDAISAKIKELEAVKKVNADKKFNLNINDKTIKEIDTKIGALKEFKNETFSPFESGLKVAGGIVGGVVSGNIITPMLRNPMAAWKQKSALDREKMQNDARLYNENRIILAQNQVGQSDYKVKTVSNPYPTSGSMKI